jgi:hypothetical protein
MALYQKIEHFSAGFTVERDIERDDLQARRQDCSIGR